MKRFFKALFIGVGWATLLMGITIGLTYAAINEDPIVFLSILFSVVAAFAVWIVYEELGY